MMNLKTPKTVLPKRSLGLSRSFGLFPVTTPEKSINTAEMRPNTTDTPFKSNNCAATKTISEVSTTTNTKNVALKSNLNATSTASKLKYSTYKLSLCKATNEAATRKRMLSRETKLKRSKLEPKSDNIRAEESNSVRENEICDTESSLGECDRMSGENELHSDSSLLYEIDEIKNKIAATEKHQQQTSELQGLITKWQEAGRRTVEEIREKFVPTQDVETILAHYHIDPGLFNLNLSE